MGARANYGTTREQLGQVAINARRNGALNPKAIFRDPITMDDYLSARMISWPLCLYDCDAFSDASAALIVSAAPTAGDLKSIPISIDAVSTSSPCVYSWEQPVEPACYPTARRLWTLTDYTVDDVDVGQLYDGFSFLTLQ